MVPIKKLEIFTEKYQHLLLQQPKMSKFNRTKFQISKFRDKLDMYTSVKCHVKTLRIYLLKLRDDQGKIGL